MYLPDGGATTGNCDTPVNGACEMVIFAPSTINVMRDASVVPMLSVSPLLMCSATTPLGLATLLPATAITYPKSVLVTVIYVRLMINVTAAGLLALRFVIHRKPPMLAGGELQC